VGALQLGIGALFTDLGVQLTELVSAAEEAGLESLLLTDHTHIPASRRDIIGIPEYSQGFRILDQFAVLGAAAVLSSRLKLGTGICVIPQRDPIIVAKQVATLDHLSGGRLLFGVGAGWLVEEMVNHGVVPGLRWDVMAEQIQAMKAIWTHDEAEFHGQYVNFDPILLGPKPVQQPHPAVLVGGSGPRALRVAAGCGDGWMPVVEDAQQFTAQLSELHRLCEEAGRPDIEVTAALWGIDEPLMAHCAELGVARLVVIAPTHNSAALQSFLNQYVDVAGQICQ
jgi:probable F420-dependent oxidoreductase